MRYFKEVEGVDRVIANDFSAEAVAAIARNIEYNELSTTDHILPSHSDARCIRANHR